MHRRGAISQNTAAQAAALTSQLLSAQSRVPTAQNALLTVWINYLNSRLQLYRDLELMPLDARGVWNDDPASFGCDATTVSGTVPSPVLQPGNQSNGSPHPVTPHRAAKSRRRRPNGPIF